MTEGAQIGTSVLQVSAHDKDLGLNGQVCYPLRWIEPHPSAQFQFFMSHFDLESIWFATMFTHEYMHLMERCRYCMLYLEFACRDGPEVKFQIFNNHYRKNLVNLF